jgi:Holliday junction resolvase RusA-like endonuclease
MTTSYFHVITFPKPPTTNETINAARSNKFVAAKSKKHHTEVARITTERYMLSRGITEPVIKPYIIADISYQTSASDIDNLAGCLKYIMDGLVKAGLMVNDNLAHTQDLLIVKATKVKNKEEQRVILYLSNFLDLDFVSQL